MSSYHTFAQFYDTLTENADYKVRSEYISNFFSRFGGNGKKLLDLACGTGSLSKIFSDMGYNVTGLDLSDDMLAVADNKCGGSVKFVKGNMTDFSFEEKFDFCICSLDSLNHLTDYTDLKKCFKNVCSSLDRDGIFVFDVNTIYKHKKILCDNTFVFDEEDFFLSWDNEYQNDHTVRIILDFFVFNGKNYDRYSEEFFEKAYSIDEISNALDGFEILGIYDELTENPPEDNSERLYFVCKRKNNYG